MLHQVCISCVTNCASARIIFKTRPSPSPRDGDGDGDGYGDSDGDGDGDGDVIVIEGGREGGRVGAKTSLGRTNLPSLVTSNDNFLISQ